MKGLDITMNNWGFELCLISFLMLQILTFFWTSTSKPEDYFYRSMASTIGMSLLLLLLVNFESNTSDEKGTKLLVILSAIFVILSTVQHILKLTIGSTKKFELRFLVFLIPVAVSLYVFIFLIFPERLESSFLLNFTEVLSVISGLTGVFIAFYASKIYGKREQSLKSELRNTKRYLNINYLENDLFKSNFSKSELLKIEEAVTRLFLISQNEIPSTIDVLNVLKNCKLPSNLLHVIMERLYTEDLLRRCPIMTLVEFQQELLPEIFSVRRVYRSSSMDMRYYEDFNERVRFILKNDNKALEELNQKIDYLSKHIEKSLDAKNTESTEPYGCQNQIRELFHALETPIATSEMAISNLLASFDSLTDEQESKFAKIQNNIKLIKSILFAYRELTFMNIYSSENTFFSLPTIIDSMKDIVSCATMNSISIEQHGIPDNIPPYSTNLIVVLILPLIHNAIEASPKKKSVLVNYTESAEGYIIQIKNHCKQLPSQINLDTEGYSSKGDNHVGTGISIVRRISKSVGVEFLLKVNNNQVIAQLGFPKR